LTGLSDGATTVEFALIQSHWFAAAVISTCCVEPWTVMAYGGTAYADRMRRLGFPPASRPDPAFWTPMSLALNAVRIDTPLLMQLSDDEYLLSLEAFTALRENHKPVDMYVFPNEHHIKWQPSHRLAIYRRNLDWFAFWLKDKENPDPAKRSQYQRWEQLRQGRVVR
jgi:dipeptidyl aminopeptidase/acylaminoacyl peptidase